MKAWAGLGPRRGVRTWEPHQLGRVASRVERALQHRALCALASTVAALQHDQRAAACHRRRHSSRQKRTSKGPNTTAGSGPRSRVLLHTPTESFAKILYDACQDQRFIISSLSSAALTPLCSLSPPPLFSLSLSLSLCALSLSIYLSISLALCLSLSHQFWRANSNFRAKNGKVVGSRSRARALRGARCGAAARGGTTAAAREREREGA